MIPILILTAVSVLPSGQPKLGLDNEELEPLMRKGTAALRAGKIEEAQALAKQAVAIAPREPRAYLFRGSVHAAQRRHADAIADFDKCLQLDPAFADAWQRRGEERFKLAEIDPSLDDFDKFLELRPDARPGHWQRGISLYYAGKFKEGAEQFKAGDKVFANDVENAVWHYLCNVRVLGSEKARQSLLKIGKDRRVPLMVIYELFAGRAKPEDVLAAVREGDPQGPELKTGLFYAHLYLGLYYDATGDTKKALEHLNQAAEDQGIGGYMGDVTRVHRQLLSKKATGR
jgi:lipoprotein NlpI